MSATHSQPWTTLSISTAREYWNSRKGEPVWTPDGQQWTVTVAQGPIIHLHGKSGMAEQHVNSHFLSLVSPDAKDAEIKRLRHINERNKDKYDRLQATARKIQKERDELARMLQAERSKPSLLGFFKRGN